MFYEDHEKAIYSPPFRPELKFDPLAVDRLLMVGTRGKLSDLLALFNGPPKVDDGLGGVMEGGDVSKVGREEAKMSQIESQGILVEAARTAFGIGPFNPERSETTEGSVLELLLDYLWWMEKKGQRGETPPTS